MPTWIIPMILIIAQFFSYIYAYYAVYVVTGLFTKRKFPKAKNLHKYAILIAARNEEKVLANLIESIHRQDYPKELIDIFVVADNCTDRTAQIARDCGAHCYERNDPDHRTKGFALQYLLERIREDYGIEAFEAYFIFDADNLLKQDYIRHMNDSFDAGEKIVTSYRNTKNFDANWIAASYGLHWIRTARFEHRARAKFRLATRIQGTGYLFSNEIVREHGWRYTSLTEDRAFCADAVVSGYRICYNDEAIFYDEQPENLRIALRQRVRWSKGHLQALAESGGKLFLHIFRKGSTVEYEEDRGSSPVRQFFVDLRLRFSRFDMLTIVFPSALVGLLAKLLVHILRIALIFTAGYAAVAGDLIPASVDTVCRLLGVQIVVSSAMETVALLFAMILLNIAITFVRDCFMAAFIFFVERRRIPPIKWYKKLWFCMNFAFFDYIGKISLLIAMCSKVEWKPIPHEANIDIRAIDQKYEEKTHAVK